MLKIIIPIVVVLLLAFVLKSRAQQSGAGYQNIDAAQFKEIQKQKDVVVLDVRTPQEIKGGKVKGAMEIDALAPGLKEKLAKLDPSKTYLVYCRSGRRSANVCSQLAGMNIEKVYNLNGGYGTLKK